MADGVPITAGSGTSIATDDIGGAHYQRVKLIHGADGVNDGDVAGGNGLPIQGDTAAGAADADYPVKIGGKALTGIATPVADTQRANAWFDEYGRLVISDKDNELGLTGGMTALRDRIVAQRYTVLSDSLADGISAFWTQTLAGGGTITSTVGEGQLKTSTGTTGSAHMVSTTVVYYPGQVNWMNSAARFNDTGTAGNIRRIGMFTLSGTTPQEGFYFELSGTTLNAVYVKAGVATATASTSWSRFATAPFTLDTNYHSFEIRYTANSVWFYVDNVLRHAVSGTATPLTTTLNFPIAIQNTKTSGATDITFAVRNIGNGRFGAPGGVVAETGLSAVEALAVGGGTPHDSVDFGNPLKVGGRASATAQTAVADGDRVNAWFDTSGRQQVAPSSTLWYEVDVPGIVAAAYAAGDQMGTIITIANAARVTGGGGVITSVLWHDNDDAVGAIDVVFFNDTLTLAADNAAFSISDADARKAVFVANLAVNQDWALNRFMQLSGIAAPYFCTATSLYAAVICRTAFTVAANTSNRIRICLSRD